MESLERGPASHQFESVHLFPSGCIEMSRHLGSSFLLVLMWHRGLHCCGLFSDGRASCGQSCGLWLVQQRVDTESVEPLLQAAGRSLQVERGMSVADVMVKLPGGCTGVPNWEQRLEKVESVASDHEDAIVSLEKPTECNGVIDECWYIFFPRTNVC